MRVPERLATLIESGEVLALAHGPVGEISAVKFIWPRIEGFQLHVAE